MSSNVFAVRGFDARWTATAWRQALGAALGANVSEGSRQATTPTSRPTRGRSGCRGDRLTRFSGRESTGRSENRMHFDLITTDFDAAGRGGRDRPGRAKLNEDQVAYPLATMAGTREGNEFRRHRGG